MALRSILMLLVLLSGFISASCGWPTVEEAKKEFLTKNPNYHILSVAAIEGDSSAVYYRFKFMRPDDEKIYVENWAFLYREKTDRWEVVGIEREE